MKEVLGILIAIVGLSVILLVIYVAFRDRKRQVDDIISNIKARGPINYKLENLHE